MTYILGIGADLSTNMLSLLEGEENVHNLEVALPALFLPL